MSQLRKLRRHAARPVPLDVETRPISRHGGRIDSVKVGGVEYARCDPRLAEAEREAAKLMHDMKFAQYVASGGLSAETFARHSNITIERARELLDRAAWIPKLPQEPRTGWCVEPACENCVSGPGLRFCWEHGFAERAERLIAHHESRQRLLPEQEAE